MGVFSIAPCGRPVTDPGTSGMRVDMDVVVVGSVGVLSIPLLSTTPAAAAAWFALSVFTFRDWGGLPRRPEPLDFVGPVDGEPTNALRVSALPLPVLRE